MCFLFSSLASVSNSITLNINVVGLFHLAFDLVAVSQGRYFKMYSAGHTLAIVFIV